LSAGVIAAAILAPTAAASATSVRPPVDIKATTLFAPTDRDGPGGGGCIAGRGCGFGGVNAGPKGGPGGGGCIAGVGCGFGGVNAGPNGGPGGGGCVPGIGCGFGGV
jgi:hypothetical protein